MEYLKFDKPFRTVTIRIYIISAMGLKWTDQSDCNVVYIYLFVEVSPWNEKKFVKLLNYLSIKDGKE